MVRAWKRCDFDRRAGTFGNWLEQLRCPIARGLQRKDGCLMGRNGCGQALPERAGGWCLPRREEAAQRPDDIDVASHKASPGPR